MQQTFKLVQGFSSTYFGTEWGYHPQNAEIRWFLTMQEGRYITLLDTQVQYSGQLYGRLIILLYKLFISHLILLIEFWVGGTLFWK